MSRNRLLVVAALLVVFAIAGVAVVRSGLIGGGGPVTVNVTVSGKTMSPDNPVVHQGDKVTLTVTADRKEEVHLHGYDITFEIEKAGGSVTRTFSADKSGDFTIEIEDTGKELGNLTVKP